MGCEVITSGYVSMDHILKIDTPAHIGHTSLITNSSCDTTFFGGCGVNIAYTLCRLGHSAMPVIRVGPDWEISGFKQFLEQGDVPLDGIELVDQELTSSSYLIENRQGEHITCFYPGSMDGRYHVPLKEALFEDARYGVITVAARVDNEDFYQRCREAHIPVVFGMKSDKSAFPHTFLRELLTHSDIIFMNESERSCIEKEFGLSSIGELVVRGEARVVVTTYGAQGSTYFYRSQNNNNVLSECVPICGGTPVIDSTGGGDAYMAGFLYGLLEGRDLEACCRMGSVLSSFALEHEGCCTGVPSLADFYKRYESFCRCTCEEH